MCCWGELTYLYIYFLISFLETKSGKKKSINGRGLLFFFWSRIKFGQKFLIFYVYFWIEN